ncbi:S8 family peptidase [Streptomyces sp. AK02-01A]|uniref:S8 family peptidase n=1 Tax=Streptomyces sp. AK02-01A TaxID=3028648 RepID=UPI0029B9BB80|nr:S8 family serine peptidase [Streptomyces sp. AK02-01A]MDX3853700.1 S8 family serine peptidase [Streptomyces sp. AK02-01A]
MRGSKRTTTAAVMAGAAALILATTGMTALPSAAQERGAGPAVKTTAGPARTVTLITGDQVLLDGRDKVLQLRPAKGRQSVPVQIREVKGHTYVLPSDAAGMIATGKLDIRLFDVTELSRPEYRELTGDGIPLIVTYTGSGSRSATRDTLRAQPGTTVRAEIGSVGGEALTVRGASAAAVWTSLTTGSAQGHRLASGVRSIRLDGLVKASLDVSVAQIGAPDAWHAGYDGEGVRVAVLDTGVDTRHADLASQVVAEENFTNSPDATDHFGHGTHVASTIAGTGAASGGKYKGVAPGVELISGKVLNDGGAGTESSIMAGMEWAVEQGATIVNLSLGGGDTPGDDPLEETVNKLSDRALFVIAAGNDGPGAGTLGSPGTAQSALTVGAVDKQDALASFSSRGPRAGDSGLKPDLTAPGVDITAAAAAGSRIDTSPATPHPAPGYLTISGTSMATPHVAGAAALLSQQHPDWSGTRLKEALVGSARPGPYSAVEQGSGRVDLTRAVAQNVVAEPASLSFGAPAWPHDDDQPITKTLSYRNSGGAAITLDLSATATGPSGTPAPDGFFTLGASRVTVPAGGTASVDVTADARLGGTALGVYSLAVTASAGKQSVRTAGALNLEGEMYDLTLRATARDGSAPADGDWSGFIYNLDADTMVAVSGDHGTAQLRLPRAHYTVLGEVPLLSPELYYIGDDFVAAPRLLLDKDTTLPVDARKTKLIDLAAPDPDASYSSGFVTITPDGAPGPIALYIGTLTEGFRTQQVGPPPARGTVSSHIVATFESASAQYLLADTVKDGFYTGRTLRPRRGEFARITSHQGASVGGRSGQIVSTPGAAVSAYSFTALPGTVTTYVQGGQSWQRTFQQMRGRTVEAEYRLPVRTYHGGREYTEDFNSGVFGPALGADAGAGLSRDGDRLTGSISPFADGAGHGGESLYDTASASTTLYRDGEEFATVEGGLDSAAFDLPGARARYRLVTTVSRAESGVAAVSTEVTWSAEFTSGRTTKATAVPASVVRYTPRLASDSTAVAGARQSVPVTVRGSAAGRDLKSLTVYASYDRGTTWSRLVVRDGSVTVVNPAAGGTVSFKAEVVDRRRAVFSQTILDAYRTR